MNVALPQFPIVNQQNDLTFYIQEIYKSLTRLWNSNDEYGNATNWFELIAFKQNISQIRSTGSSNLSEVERQSRKRSECRQTGSSNLSEVKRQSRERTECRQKVLISCSTRSSNQARLNEGRAGIRYQQYRFSTYTIHHITPYIISTYTIIGIIESPYPTILHCDEHKPNLRHKQQA